VPFTPDGYDERQYASPGINLAVGRLTRSLPGQFAQYHTSADDLSLIRPDNLAESLRVCLGIVEALEQHHFPINRYPCGEPQLGRRGIFRAFGERDDRGRLQEAMMWVLNLGDGRHDTLAIAERAGLPHSIVVDAAAHLRAHGLIDKSNSPDPGGFLRYHDQS
jgi:aminopeptidase-like protein